MSTPKAAPAQRGHAATLTIIDEAQRIQAQHFEPERTPFWKHALQGNPTYLAVWKEYQAGLITVTKFGHQVHALMRACERSEQIITAALAAYPQNALLRPHFRTIAPFTTTNEGKKS